MSLECITELPAPSNPLCHPSPACPGFQTLHPSYDSELRRARGFLESSWLAEVSQINPAFMGFQLHSWAPLVGEVLYT